jgi:hypothetical protein
MAGGAGFFYCADVAVFIELAQRHRGKTGGRPEIQQNHRRYDSVRCPDE